MSERYSRSCAGKRAYNSERRAAEAAKGSQILYGQPMNAYKCEFCNRWHVGSTLPWNSSTARRERSEAHTNQAQA